MYTVKEVAKLLSLSEHTIRFYSDKGLIPNVQRDANNIRNFDEMSLNWVLVVKYLKHSGMSLEDIKTYVDLCLEGDSTIQRRYAIINKQKEIAMAQLEEAKQRVAYMVQKSNYYQDIINHVIPDDSNPQRWAIDEQFIRELGQQIQCVPSEAVDVRKSS